MSKPPESAARRRLRELAVAALASPAGVARLECGCFAGRGGFRPCLWHRDEFTAALLAACAEDPGECDSGCCDPA